MGKWKNHRAGVGGSPEARREGRHRQELGWARRTPHAELTASPEADADAAVQRQLAQQAAERTRQAGQLPQVRPEPGKLDTGRGALTG